MEQRAVQVMSEWVIAYDRWQDQGMAWPGSSEVGGYWSAKEKDMLLVIFKNMTTASWFQSVMESWVCSPSRSLYAH